MPIRVRKLPNKELYRVYNVETKEVHSYATSKKNALKQKRLLDAIEHGFIPSKKGGSIIKDVTSGITSRVKAITTGEREAGLPPSSRNTLKKYGDIPIQSAVIFRYEIPKAITSFLQLVTKNKVFKNVEYDKLFHLGILFTLTNGKTIIVEKNEIVNISDKFPAIPKTANLRPLSIPSSYTLNEIIDKTRNKMGLSNFEKYSALTLNCQQFIKSLLQANNIGSSSDISFVTQDVSHILKDVNKSPVLSKLIQGSTDLARGFNILIHGASRLKGGADREENTNQEENLDQEENTNQLVNTNQQQNVTQLNRMPTDEQLNRVPTLKKQIVNSMIQNIMRRNRLLTFKDVRDMMENYATQRGMISELPDIMEYTDEYLTRLSEYRERGARILTTSVNTFVDILLELCENIRGRELDYGMLRLFLNIHRNTPQQVVDNIITYVRNTRKINIIRTLKRRLMTRYNNLPENIFNDYDYNRTDAQLSDMLRPALAEIIYEIGMSMVR